LINTAMVRQTRFDALHDAATEQQLFEALPRLARDAMAQGVATAALTTAGERVERSEEHTSELQSPCNLVCRLLLEKKNNKRYVSMQFTITCTRYVTSSTFIHLLLASHLHSKLSLLV